MLLSFLFSLDGSCVLIKGNLFEQGTRLPVFEMLAQPFIKADVPPMNEPQNLI